MKRLRENNDADVIVVVDEGEEEENHDDDVVKQPATVKISQCPDSLLPELWHAITSPPYIALQWLRTRVMLRRTSKWFAANVPAPSNTAVQKSGLLYAQHLVEEIRELFKCREWWPTLAHCLHVTAVGGVPGQYFWPGLLEIMEDILRQASDMSVFWYIYHSVRLDDISESLATKGRFPYTWWRAVISSGCVRNVRELWGHARIKDRTEINVLSLLLRTSLLHYHLPLYEWLTLQQQKSAFYQKISKRSNETMLMLNSEDFESWKNFLAQEYIYGPRQTTPSKPGNPQWAAGFVAAVIKPVPQTQQAAKDNHDYWNIIRSWAGMAPVNNNNRFHQI